MSKIKILLVAFCLLAPVSAASASLRPGVNAGRQQTPGFCWWQYQSEKESVAVLSSAPEATASRSGNTLTTSYPHAGNFGCGDQILQTTHTWTVPPSQLVVGQEMVFEVSASWELTGSRECTSLTTGVHTSLTAGATTIVAKRSNINITKEPSDSVANSGSWVVPAGSQVGDLLTITANGNTGIGGGTVIYTYSYACMATPDMTAEAEKTAQAEKITPEPTATNTPWPETVCGGYTRDHTWGDSGCRFSDFSGEVTVAMCYSPDDVEPAEMDMVLSKGSVINTEAESNAILSFADMTTFHMKPFTRVFLEPGPPRQSNISLLAGKIWVNVKKMIETGEMNVTTVQAVAGTKGTIFVVEKTDQETILKVVEGTVSFTSLVTLESIDVQAGEEIHASGTGLGAIGPFDVAAEVASWPEAQTAEPVEIEPTLSPTETDTPGDAQPGRSLPMVWLCAGGIMLLCCAGIVVLVVVVIYYLQRNKSINR